MGRLALLRLPLLAALGLACAAGGIGPAAGDEGRGPREPRRIDYAEARPRFDDDLDGEIAASVYSLPSGFFAAGAVRALLAAVHAGAPRRTLLALVDPAQKRELTAKGLPPLPAQIRLLETASGRSFSPWPRDPFSLARRPGGGLLVLLRPNLQRGREEDATMGRELLAALPEDLDRAWGRPAWATAPVPFHNGQVLLTRDAAWITLHTLEPRILGILGIERVPVESFATAEGLDRYLRAARTAAGEIGALYGRPARFVHPLPEAGPVAGRAARMREIGGGAGQDLDSLVTLLPGRNGRLSALVADLSRGSALLAKLDAPDAEALRAGYGLGPGAVALGPALASAQDTPQAADLDRFLDVTAGHLAAEGLEVHRLPLLLMPYSLLADSAGLPAGGAFLLGWNNAVIETREGRPRAEAFASFLPAGDREAVAAYAAAGTPLDLLPSLPKSVILGGGYRCASNHVRATR